MQALQQNLVQEEAVSYTALQVIVFFFIEYCGYAVYTN